MSQSIYKPCLGSIKTRQFIEKDYAPPAVFYLRFQQLPKCEECVNPVLILPAFIAVSFQGSMECSHLFGLAALHNTSHIKRKLIFEVLADEICLADPSSAIDGYKFRLPRIVILINQCQFFFSSDYNLFHTTGFEYGN